MISMIMAEEGSSGKPASVHGVLANYLLFLIGASEPRGAGRRLCLPSHFQAYDVLSTRQLCKPANHVKGQAASHATWHSSFSDFHRMYPRLLCLLTNTVGIPALCGLASMLLLCVWLRVQKFYILQCKNDFVSALYSFPKFIQCKFIIPQFFFFFVYSLGFEPIAPHILDKDFNHRATGTSSTPTFFFFLLRWPCWVI